MMMLPTYTKSPKPFILVIEGIDFSGKTTLANHMQAALGAQSYHVKVLHDPKGSKHSYAIWETILALQTQEVSPTTLFFLFLAARHELIIQEVYHRPTEVIIFDRFIFSTIAYQLTHQKQYWELFLTIHQKFSLLMPDLCIYCDLDFKTFQLRSQTRNKKDPLDQMSQNRFEAIQQAYQHAWRLNICPMLQIQTLKNDSLSALVDQTVGYISAHNQKEP